MYGKTTYKNINVIISNGKRALNLILGNEYDIAKKYVIVKITFMEEKQIKKNIVPVNIKNIVQNSLYLNSDEFLSILYLSVSLSVNSLIREHKIEIKKRIIKLKRMGLIPVVHLKKDCPCDQIIVYLIEYKSVKYHEQSY